MTRNRETLRQSHTQRKIVYGAFKGMGDLLSAAPVIAAQLDRGHKVWLLCFPGKGLGQFADLIDFGPGRENLTVWLLPVSSKVRDFRSFLAEASRFQPDLVWISPHASQTASSWRIPLLLWVTRQLCWGGARIAGTITERLSFLFDVAVPVDRELPLMERERTAFAAAERSGSERVLDRPSKIAFIDRVSRPTAEPASYDVLIHPGANAQNRTWPTRCYAEVVTMIPRAYRIAVLGLPEDVASLKRELPADLGIIYLTGNLEQALRYIARARVVLTMDSGNVHFANVLNVPTVALFGKADPATIVAAGGSVVPIYQRRYPCQPCQRATCNQPELYCMNSIKPETVATALVKLLAG